MNDWSFKQVEDLIVDREEWKKKTVYVTDHSRCPRGVYFSLIGSEPTNPIPPKNIRRMEIGQMIERNLVNKLKSLGIFLGAQWRIYDEENGISGRPDAIIISPTSCTDEAKEMIAKRVELHKQIKTVESDLWSLLTKYEIGDINRATFLRNQSKLNKKKTELLDTDAELVKQLLVPNPENSLMVGEIKSIVDKGFDWRKKEGKPMEDHTGQLMYYLFELRKKYPWMVGRVIYVSTSYQDLLEFNVEMDEDLVMRIKAFAKHINECVKNGTPPEPAPAVIRNPMNGKWQVNQTAAWCDHHINCTGDANWLDKAFKEVERLNEQDKIKNRL